MATRRIREYLLGHKISYGSINHTCAYTAEEVAELARVPGRQMAKVVIVWLEGELAIVVVPATKIVDMEKLQRETDAGEVLLADESDFRDRFSDCQVGTVPPFGNLFGVDTWLDRQLTLENHLAFNAGTHRDVMVIRYADYNRLVKPRIVDVAVEPSPDSSIAKPGHVRSRSQRSDSRTQSEEAESESAMQMQCGCPISHHHAGSN
jgi:Ala-tRNA(Pro) deacylase